jgi:Tol biopolymer transport system component
MTVSGALPAWSPDGPRILSTTFVGAGDNHLEIMNAGGSGRTRLPGDPGKSAVATWLPDGSWIAFIALGAYPSARPRIRVHIVQKNSASPAACAAPPSTTVHLSQAATLPGRRSSPSTRTAVPSVTHQ